MTYLYDNEEPEWESCFDVQAAPAILGCVVIVVLGGALAVKAARTHVASAIREHKDALVRLTR